MAALMNRILAATDLSIAGQHAVMRAGQLARQWQASLRIVHARPDWNLYARWRPASQDAYQLIARRTDQLLGELQAKVTAEFRISPRVDSRLGRASEVVAEMVSEFDPSLLVIGARGEHAQDGGSNIGGTACKLLTRFGHAMLLVRVSDASPYAKSVVAVDGPAPLARRAVLWGTSLVGSGETHIVHAYCIPYIERMRSPDESGPPGAASSPDGPSGDPLKQAADAAAATLAEVRGAAETVAQVETHAVHADPVVATLQQIARHAAPVVVIGKRNVPTPLVPSGPIGNVAFRIADHAPADVLILS
jgi:nucleotide-binding universal stress UspA family protein